MATDPITSDPPDHTRETGGSTKTVGTGESLEQECLDPATHGLMVLVDLGSSLSGLRALADQENLLGRRIGQEQIEPLERVIVDFVQSLALSITATEAVALGILNADADADADADAEAQAAGATGKGN